MYLICFHTSEVESNHNLPCFCVYRIPLHPITPLPSQYHSSLPAMLPTPLLLAQAPQPVAGLSTPHLVTQPCPNYPTSLTCLPSLPTPCHQAAPPQAERTWTLTIWPNALKNSRRGSRLSGLFDMFFMRMLLGGCFKTSWALTSCFWFYWIVK